LVSENGKTEEERRHSLISVEKTIARKKE